MTRFTTADGFEVWLAQMRIQQTWEGVLLGDPEVITARIRQDNFSRFAKESHGNFGTIKAFVVVDEGWSQLPHYECFCLLQSEPIQSAKVDFDFQSRLGVCLFFDEIPTNFPLLVQQAVGALSWSSDAEDFDDSP